tara:strand:+ start:63 stop:278 length:216 start_codon:yes stop_codon:yes gene_type:complete
MKKAKKQTHFSPEGLSHLVRIQQRQLATFNLDVPLDNLIDNYRPCPKCGWAVNDFMCFCVKCNTRFKPTRP